MKEAELIIAKMHGEVVGEVTLKNGGLEKYQKADSVGKMNIRLQIAVEASKRYGFDCMVIEQGDS